MRRFKPSPAMAVALLALLVGLGGSAFAASHVITKSSQIKDGAVTSADVKNSSLTDTDIKDKSLTPSDFNGSVQGPQGPAGSQGPAGASGAPGAAGSARAYALVNTENCPGIPPSPCEVNKSKNITSVVRLQGGTYCVTPAAGVGIDPAGAPAMVGVGFRHTASPEADAAAMGDADNALCAAGQFAVVTKRISTGTYSDTVAFWIAVP